MKRFWLLSVLIPMTGCVRLSTYRKLQSQQQETAQSLQASRADNVKLQQKNDKLSSDLAETKKQLANLISDLKSDLVQAQAGITSAMDRLAQQKTDSEPASAAASAPADSKPSPVAPPAASKPVSATPASH